MGDKTGISWTDASWNPVVGCSIVSKGCQNCYAMGMAARIERMAPGGKPSHYAGLTRVVNGNAVWTGEVRVAPDHIFTQPLRWAKPRRIFVNSMSDLFHHGVGWGTADAVMSIIARCPQHVFQVLTKRPDRMRAYMVDASTRLRDRIARESVSDAWPLPNLWLGVSAEDQKRADERVPDLISTPAALRFVSAEPLLGPIDFAPFFVGHESPSYAQHNGKRQFEGMSRRYLGLDWIIVGGESGPGARPMQPQWARDIRDQCETAGMAFFHKQNGEFASVSEIAGIGDHFTFPDGSTVRKVGKARAGHLLDGIEHHAFPEVAR